MKQFFLLINLSSCTSVYHHPDPDAILEYLPRLSILKKEDKTQFLTSVSDLHKFSCGSGSRIPKMSIWIRIQTPNFLFGSGSKGGKSDQQILKCIFQNDIKTPFKN